MYIEIENKIMVCCFNFSTVAVPQFIVFSASNYDSAVTGLLLWQHAGHSLGQQPARNSVLAGTVSAHATKISFSYISIVLLKIKL